jgi:hypothetical protein
MEKWSSPSGMNFIFFAPRIKAVETPPVMERAAAFHTMHDVQPSVRCLFAGKNG